METDIAKLMDVYGEMAVTYALDVIGALLLLIGGWVVAAWVKRTMQRQLTKLDGVDPTVVGFLSNLCRYLVLIIVLIAVLAQFGVETASILAVLGTIGLAVGLALQGTLSNIAGGIVLLFLRPFRVGDYVDAGGQAGTVQEIGLFTTELTTFDGVYLSVPNSQVAAGPILNYSRHPTRRIDIAVGIGYGDDVDQGLAVLKALLEKDSRVLKDPAPEVMVIALADSSVNLNMRCWTSTDDFWALTFDLNREAKAAIEGAGLSIPFPQQDVHIVTGDAAGGPGQAA